MRKIARLAATRPRAVIAGWLLLLVLAVPFALRLEGALKTGGFSDPRGESVEAQHTIEHAFEEAPDSLLVVLHSKDGPVAGSIRKAREAAEREGASGVTDRTTHPEWMSGDGRTTFLQVGFAEDDIAAVGDRVVDATIAHGDEDVIAARVREQCAAGADHVLLFPTAETLTAADDALERLADAVLAR